MCELKSPRFGHLRDLSFTVFHLILSPPVFSIPRAAFMPQRVAALVQRMSAKLAAARRPDGIGVDLADGYLSALGAATLDSENGTMGEANADG